MKKFRIAGISSAAVLAAAAVQYFPQTLTADAASQDIFINEVCSQNKSCLTDSYGKHADWIEIYNAGSTKADISGYGLSDRKDSPLKWIFPAGTSVEAGGYLVVIASENETSGNELHTGFSLSKNGETLVLSTPDGNVFQEVEVPVLGEDFTYGRTPDGSSAMEIMSPTPAAANAVVISAPSFSEPSGFYGSNISLSMSAPAGTTIYYTVDGSNPAVSKTASVYSSPLTVQDRSNEENIYSKYEENDSNTGICRGVGYKKPNFKVDKATVVRAVAKSSDGKISGITEQTYFITNGNLSKYKDMTVVSLVTDPENLFDPDKGIYVNGNQFVSWRNSGAYNPSKSVWDTDNVTNYFSKGQEWERESTVSIFEKGSLAAEQSMGLRIKGASTRNSAQKSFNVFARSEYGASKLKYAIFPENYSLADGELIDKYDSLSIRSVSEETRLRDGFAQRMLKDRDMITTQDMKPCAVFLNGEYWGLYEITEKLSDYFIETNYGIPKQEVAMIKANEPEEGGQEECDRFLDFVNTYSRKDLTDTANYKAVCDFIDIDTMIEHYAAGIYLGTFDWPNYNYGVWRNTGEAIEGNPYSDGKWRFISYDFDYTMGATYKDFGGVEGFAYNSFRHMDNGKDGEPTNLFVNLLKNPDFKAKFISVMCDYANAVMTSEKAEAMADMYSKNYTDPLAYTQARWWGFFGGMPESLLPYYRSEYQSKALGEIKNFFRQRPSYIMNHMKEYLGVSGQMQTITVDVKGKGKVRISSLYADSSGKISGQYLSDSPVTLTAIPDEGQAFAGWSGDADGMDMSITITLSKAMSITASFDESAANVKKKGDINSDGKVNSADVLTLQKYLLGTGTLSDNDAGDMDSDGRISIADLCLIKEAVLK